MNNTSKQKTYGILWLMVVLSSILLSIPWLVPHCGWLALIALVPLLSAERVAEQNNVKRFWLWHYTCFVIWNALTTFWVGNATVGGGIFAVLANSLQMSVVFGLFRLSKKKFRGILPYLFLMFAWIAWERWYMVSAEISWPWLVFGNAFAKSIKTIQWYEFTGTLGGSLWVWAANFSLFGLMVSILEGSWFRWNRFAKWSSVIGTVIVVVFPFAASAHLWHHFEEESEGKVNVLIAQPNFDPYQKFESMSQQQQNNILLAQFDSALTAMPAPAEAEAVTEKAAALNLWEGLLIAPETFTGDIFLNDVQSSATWRSFQEFLQKYPNADFLFGASTYEFFHQRSAPSILAREYGLGWVENHNSAFVTDHTGRYDLFHKSKLVVGTELTPYPKIFVPIDNKLGGLMGRVIGQKEIATMNYVASDSIVIPFGCAICYESVYPEYCTGYVLKGAKFMTIITNDAWWGNTPGYKQHANYASLRAIELRRDIARCGNTGISGIINQRGEYLSTSNWWQRETLSGQVNTASRKTFFVRHGDLVGRISTFAFLLLFSYLIVSLLIRRRN
ncbi:MAG: apolipoprotein N-acyltransferase [Candidatus Cryptobacteroides sp.]|jgi:apolipoprotein N-acyltransferase